MVDLIDFFQNLFLIKFLFEILAVEHLVNVNPLIRVKSDHFCDKLNELFFQSKVLKLLNHPKDVFPVLFFIILQILKESCTIVTPPPFFLPFYVKRGEFDVKLEQNNSQGKDIHFLGDNIESIGLESVTVVC